MKLRKAQMKLIFSGFAQILYQYVSYGVFPKYQNMLFNCIVLYYKPSLATKLYNKEGL